MDDLAKVAAALSDPLRLRILDLLLEGRGTPCNSPPNPSAPAAVCACDIACELGGLAQSKLAYHLSQLRAAGLVTEQRRGKWVYYSLSEETLLGFARTIVERWSSRRTERRAPATILSAPPSSRTRRPGRPLS